MAAHTRLQLDRQGVLHPLSRYLTYLQDELIFDQNKEVIMLGILGFRQCITATQGQMH